MDKSICHTKERLFMLIGQEGRSGPQNFIDQNKFCGKTSFFPAAEAALLLVPPIVTQTLLLQTLQTFSFTAREHLSLVNFARKDF